MVRVINKLFSFRLVNALYHWCGRFYPEKKFKNNKPIIIYGAMNGNFFGDNAVYQFDYNSKARDDYYHIWITKSIVTYLRLLREKKGVALMWSPEALFYLGVAEWGFFTDSLRDLCFYDQDINPNIKLIALRHGRSVKRVRFARLEHQISSKEALQRQFEGKLIKFVISTSEAVSAMQEQCLRVGREKHVVTGYPRNDFLLKSLPDEGLSDGLRILYAPTWRHGRGLTKFFPWSDFDFNGLASLMRKTGVSMDIRPHATEVYGREIQYLKSRIRGLREFKVVDHRKEPDINSILGEYDVLITDYSALYHDFLLLDRPMLFIPYDFDDFNKKNGFLYDYKLMLPGPLIESSDQFFEELSQIIRGTDRFKAKRCELSKLIHSTRDSGSRERVCNLLDYDKELS